MRARQLRRAESPRALVWFRNDLRLADNPALTAAAAGGRPVAACYVLDDADTAVAGGASRWWLAGSLERLQAAIAARGGRLLVRRGPIRRVLPELVAATGATDVHCASSGEPAGRSAETDLKRLLRPAALHLHAGALLFDPQTLRTRSGEPFKVFTPFARAAGAANPPPLPLPMPRGLRFAEIPVAADAIEAWPLLPRSSGWAGGLRDAWTPGEIAARRRLSAFVRNGLARYALERERPDQTGTSRLSPHLHFGELGSREVWHAVQTAGLDAASARGAAAYARELLWREFSAHLLWHWPTLPAQPFRREFARFPWRDDVAALERWQRGETGYPLVDAGMRQLWRTGWMHNRVRMIVASFLVKHLLIPWQAGAAWFWDTLVDADLANNSTSWQWVAGCGVDAAPYFRIFNPSLQAAKFDPDGRYVARWLSKADRRVPPMIAHAAARARALVAFRSLRAAKR